MATEPRKFARTVLRLDRAPPEVASDLLTALEGAAATAMVLFGVKGAALSVAGEDGTLGVVAMTDGADELRALAVTGSVDVMSFPIIRCIPVGLLELYGKEPDSWPEDRLEAAGAYATVVADLLRASLDTLGDGMAAETLQPLPITAAATPTPHLHQLDDLLEEITAQPAPNIVTRVVLDRGRRSLGALGGVVGRVVGPSRQIELVAWSGDQRWAAPGRRSLPLDSPVPLAEAARKRTDVWLSTRDELDRSYPGVYLAGRWEAQVAIGFSLHGRPSGVLGFGFGEPRQFDEETRVFLRILARQCALAFERDQLFDRVRETRDASRRVNQRAREVAHAMPPRVLSSEEQSVLLFEATLLTAQPDEQAIIDHFTELTVPVFADWCVVYMPYPDGSIQRRAIATANELDERQSAQVARGWRTDVEAQHPMAEVYRTRTAVLVPAITDEMIVKAMPDEEQRNAVRSMGLRSVIYLPLDGERQCVGVVGFLSTRSAPTPRPTWPSARRWLPG